jgi:hypothetical protein
VGVLSSNNDKKAKTSSVTAIANNMDIPLDVVNMCLA